LVEGERKAFDQAVDGIDVRVLIHKALLNRAVDHPVADDEVGKRVAHRIEWKASGPDRSVGIGEVPVDVDPPRLRHGCSPNMPVSTIPEPGQRKVVVIGLDDDVDALLHCQEIADVLAGVVAGGASRCECHAGAALCIEIVEGCSLEVEVRRALLVSDDDEFKATIQRAPCQRPHRSRRVANRRDDQSAGPDPFGRPGHSLPLRRSRNSRQSCPNASRTTEPVMLFEGDR